MSTVHIDRIIIKFMGVLVIEIDRRIYLDGNVFWINPISPSTVLAEFAVHTVYGAATATLLTKMADQSVFNTNFKNMSSQQPITSYANAAK